MSVVTKIKGIPTLAKRKRVAAYVRVSRDSDHMLHSFLAQVDYFKQLILSNNGWELVKVYADYGISGAREKRPEFDKMIEDCRNRKIDLILTKSVSRFARNTKVLLSSTRELKELGIDIYFEEQKLHSLSSDGELILTLLGSFAEAEAKSNSQNILWRVRNKLKEGISSNNPHRYGYEVINGKYVPKVDEAKAIRRIFDLALSGMGGNLIAKIMKNEGNPYIEGSDWNAKGIIRILRNEFYIGDELLQKGYVDNYKKKINDGVLPKYLVENNHEAIIERDVFYKVQEILNTREGNHDKRRIRDFSKKIRCGLCGHVYSPETLKNGDIRWTCSSRKKSHCKNRSVQESYLKRSIEEALGWSSFSIDKFNESFVEILIYPNNILGLVTKDGEEKKIPLIQYDRRANMSIEFIKSREIIKSPEVRLKVISLLNERWKDPEFRKRIKEGHSKYFEEYRRRKDECQ